MKVYLEHRWFPFVTISSSCKKKNVDREKKEEKEEGQGKREEEKVVKEDKKGIRRIIGEGEESRERKRKRWDEKTTHNLKKEQEAWPIR